MSDSALAADSAAPRRLAPAMLAAVGLLVALLLLIVMGIFGAIFGLRPLFSGGYGPSGLARAEIPPAYLRLYEAAGREYGIDPWVLAAIGWVETEHGRSHAAGVHDGVNGFGCCAGPMQIELKGSPSTWHQYAVDGDGDGRRSPYDPADAIPTAARYLRDAGAPEDYRAALYAYNHADWYVAEVLAKAEQYRGAPSASAGQPAGSASVRDVLHNPRVALTPIQQADLRSGTIDPRLIDTLAWIGRHHSVVITALKSDHAEYTVDGAVSNHAAGRAMDIGEVDGEVCRGTRTGKCADLVRELAAVQGPLRATELISCWAPDGPDDPRGFARADHCDHIHVGWDG